MCLSNAKKVDIPEKVTAWKILEYRNYDEGSKEIHSAYVNSFKWEIGKEMATETCFWTPGGDDEVEEIGEGMFHSFKNYSDALSVLYANPNFIPRSWMTDGDWPVYRQYNSLFCIAEVEIPNDAILYEGEFNNCKSYASNKMKISKILKGRILK
jgi:hypothetical protein